MNRRVIFPDPDIWTDPPPKENNMSDQDQTDFDDDKRIYWNQLRAIELCRAVSLGDNATADALIAEVAADDDEVHLVAGLTHVAVSLAHTVVEQRPSITEANVWHVLTERSQTGLHATRELAEMTNTTSNERDNNA
ncbi:hypothetical protein FIV07_00095 [Mycobacterium sp. THAF192]|nr:hypothetical protein FIV07_00095 [Mycobacterium sp. THAF192]